MTPGELVVGLWLGVCGVGVIGWLLLRVKWTPVGWRFVWRRDVGHNPIPPLKLQMREETRLTYAKKLYIEGEISLERFEALVEAVLRGESPVQSEQERGPVTRPSPFPLNPSNRSTS